MSAETATAADADVGFYVSTAQTLYQSAYDLYGATAYGQAARTARVAVRLAAIAGFLTAEGDGDGFGDGRDRGRRGDFDGRGPGDRDPDADEDEPVPVPEPSF